MFELTRDSAVPLVDQICERITQAGAPRPAAPGHAAALDPQAGTAGERQPVHGSGRLRSPGRARADRVARRARFLRHPPAPGRAAGGDRGARDPDGSDALALARLCLAQSATSCRGLGLPAGELAAGGGLRQRADAPAAPRLAALAALPAAGPAGAARADRRAAGAARHRRRRGQHRDHLWREPGVRPAGAALCSLRGTRCWWRTRATSCCSSSCAPTTCG